MANSSRVPPEILAALQAAFAAGGEGMKLNVIEINLPEGGNPDDVLASIADAIEARHREECAECGAAHEAKMKAYAEQERMAVKASTETETKNDAMGTPARTPIGYMAFAMKNNVMTPISGSFNVDRAGVEAKLQAFHQIPAMQAMLALSELMGQKLTPEIRPVFGE